VLAEYLPKPEGDDGTVVSYSQPVDLDDQELLERAFAASNGDKFRRLWEGDSSNYPSHSEADQAFCNLLAFWSGRDPIRMDRIFRTSGLMRDKWEREDYRERTIEAAIAATAGTYNPVGLQPVPEPERVLEPVEENRSRLPRGDAESGPVPPVPALRERVVGTGTGSAGSAPLVELVF
jgi:hypothetical protein